MRRSASRRWRAVTAFTGAIVARTGCAWWCLHRYRLDADAKNCWRAMLSAVAELAKAGVTFTETVEKTERSEIGD